VVWWRAAGMSRVDVVVVGQEQKGNKSCSTDKQASSGPWARGKVYCVSAAPAAVRVELRTC
jgi:hypothetical protein